jgi:type IV pilus assembly protein PilN
MIRINLSPKRIEIQKENLRLQMWVFALSLAVTLAGCIYFYVRASDNVYDLSLALRAEESRRAKFNAVLKTLKEQEEEQKGIDKKVKDIKKLENQRRNPFNLLRLLRNVLSNERLFLVDLHVTNDQVTLEGYAIDNATIADFVSELKRNEDVVQRASLVRSQLRYVPISWRTVHIRGPEEDLLAASQERGVRPVTPRGLLIIDGLKENETIEQYFNRFNTRYSQARPRLAGYAKEMEDEFARKLMLFTISATIRQHSEYHEVPECEESAACRSQGT